MSIKGALFYRSGTINRDYEAGCWAICWRSYHRYFDLSLLETPSGWGAGPPYLYHQDPGRFNQTPEQALLAAATQANLDLAEGVRGNMEALIGGMAFQTYVKSILSRF
jgi:hypothetical protein